MKREIPRNLEKKQRVAAKTMKTENPEKNVALKLHQSGGQAEELRNVIRRHTPEEIANIEASLVAAGTADGEIIFDEDGNVLDGYLLKELCDKHKIKFRFFVIRGLTRLEKLDLRIRKNIHRRVINRDDNRRMVASYLKLNPDISSHAAQALLGVSDKTITAVRRELEEASEIPKVEKVVGPDDKKYPARRKPHTAIAGSSQKDLDNALEAVQDLPRSSGTLDVTRAKSRAKKAKGLAKRKADLDEGNNIVLPNNEDFKFESCDFRDFPTLAKLDEESVDLICTDIPYGVAWFDANFADLARIAHALLKPGGIFVSFFGRDNWLRVGTVLSQHFTLHPLIRLRYTRPYRPHGHHITQCGEPIVLATKGEPAWPRGFADEYTSCGIEKNWHDWQKSVEDVRWLIERFSRPGALVVDLLAGSLTTAEACDLAKRRFAGCDIDPECIRIAKARIAMIYGRDKRAG